MEELAQDNTMFETIIKIDVCRENGNMVLSDKSRLIRRCRQLTFSSLELMVHVFDHAKQMGFGESLLLTRKLDRISISQIP
jgi:hypothetical protein